MNLPQNAWQISVLAESAKALAKQGNLKDATEIYERVLVAAPYHGHALRFLAARAMESSDLERCVALLERAVQAEPARARTHMNLGVALLHRGDFEAAIHALDSALQLNPTLVLAALYKGRVFEASNRPEEALSIYKQAWGKYPELAQQMVDPGIPAQQRALLQHVATQVQVARKAVVEVVLEAVRARHPGIDLGRLEQFSATCLGERPRHYADAAQQPAYLYFPGLDPLPFYDAAKFPSLRSLEQASEEIRQELENVLANPDGVSPYVQIDSAPDAGQWNELNHSLQWSAYHLFKNGRRVEAHCSLCPVTVSELVKQPLVDIEDHAPEAFFSILKPGTRIPPHYGLANYKVAVHLPLIVPGDCGIRVGHKTETWVPGKCLVFDDSFRHEAWNESDEARAVLIFEIWNPQLTAAEIDGVSQLVRTLRGFATP
jgi:aspartate beta-hydroxylase